jgi:hypothetical protein
MKTYGVRAPLETHWVRVSCAEFECKVSAQGWITEVDENTDLGKRQANYIRNHAGRHFQWSRENGLTQFVFPPGEQCFTEHRVHAERQDIFLVRGGDWRGQVGEVKIHKNPEDWVEDFATHQDAIRSRLERG